MSCLCFAICPLGPSGSSGAGTATVVHRATVVGGSEEKEFSSLLLSSLDFVIPGPGMVD